MNDDNICFKIWIEKECDMTFWVTSKVNSPNLNSWRDHQIKQRFFEMTSMFLSKSFKHKFMVSLLNEVERPLETRPLIKYKVYIKLNASHLK